MKKLIVLIIGFFIMSCNGRYSFMNDEKYKVIYRFDTRDGSIDYIKFDGTYKEWNNIAD
tara:strand:+ start:191 stop:367 length:177 start_codon:yes stop_codon:yes gene_type:complete